MSYPRIGVARKLRVRSSDEFEGSHPRAVMRLSVAKTRPFADSDSGGGVDQVEHFKDHPVRTRAIHCA